MATITSGSSQKTLFGLIPNDWKYVTFSDALNGFSSGSTPSRNIPSYFDGEILWITSGELNYNVISNTKEKITQEAVKATNLKILKPGTFLFAITGLEAAGTRGSCAIVGKEATTNQSCMALTPKKELSINYFFHYYTHFGNHLAFRFCQGTKQQSYNGSIARKLPLILPPLHEQERIAEILSTCDKAITTVKNLIDKLKIRNKGLAQQLLSGKKRLKGFEEDWKVVPLGELFTEIKEVNDGADNHHVMTISSTLGLITQESKFDRIIAGDSLKKYTLLQKGDFAYNKGNSKTYPMGCIYQLQEESALVPFVYICFRPTDKIYSDFYSFWFLEHGLDRQLKKIITSGARGDGLLNVSKKDFFKLMVPYPGKEEQASIASLLSNADKELKLYQQQIATLKEQKKGLMQKLLTGEIRVKINNQE